MDYESGYVYELMDKGGPTDNREPYFKEAVDEMIAKTSTEYAPWHILESDDKHFARIKALEIITSEIKKRL